MLIRNGIVAFSLLLAASALVVFVIGAGFGAYVSQSTNPNNAFSSALSFVNTGYLSASAQAATSGGNNDGFELDPTYAYSDDSRHAANADGPGDRHLYYNYGVSLPPGSSINGIRVRVDWWLDGYEGDNSLGVELSWDGGISWTGMKADTIESASEHMTVLGGATDIWGRLWMVNDLSDSNFRVRVSCSCSGGGQCDSRDYFLDWVAVNVFYTAP